MNNPLLGGQTKLAHLTAQTLQADLATGGYYVNPQPYTVSNVGMQISDMAGYRFATQIDNTSWPQMRDAALAGFSISINDGAGKNMVVVPTRQLGSGETYGNNLLTNPSFDTTTGWTEAGIGGSIASIAGGQSGNCLEIMTGAAAMVAVLQNNTVEIGALYGLGVYVKSGSSGNENSLVSINNTDSGTIESATTTSLPTWSLIGPVLWTADRTNISSYIKKNTTTSGTMLFDEGNLYKFLTPSSQGFYFTTTSVDSGFNYNAVTFTCTITPNFGLSNFAPTVSNGFGEVILNQTVTAGTTHLDTTSTAMFFHDTVDFSAYAGASGNTLFKVLFTDNAGKTALAYGGEAGGGENLTELSPDPGFDNVGSWDSVSADWSVNSGGNSKIVATDAAQYNGVFKDGPMTGTVGKIVKTVLVLDSRTSGGITVRAGGYVSGSSNDSPEYTTIGTKTRYFTVRNGTDPTRLLITSINGAHNTLSATSLSAGLLTDVPITGLKLYTSYNGTIRGMANVQTGFNTSTIVSIKVYRTDIAPAIYVRDGSGNLFKAYARQSAGKVLDVETHTSANAASDPNANEANATTGWGITAGGTLESISSDKSVGSYALHATAAAAPKYAESSAGAPVVRGLYEISADFKRVATGELRIEGKSPSSSVTTTTSWATYVNTLTVTVNTVNFGYYAKINAPGDETFFDNYTRRRILRPTATGLLLYTTPTGNTPGVSQWIQGSLENFVLNGSRIYTVDVVR
jgi:hypothetical protein